MRIQMLTSAAGSYDGIHIRLYEQDEEFEVGSGFMSADLAKAFLESGAAKEVGEKPQKATAPGPSETKVEGKKPDEGKKK